MALASKTSGKFYATSGGGADEIDSTRKTLLETFATQDAAVGNKQLIDDNTLGPLVLNIQRLQDDLDEIRRFVVSSDELQRHMGGGVMYASSTYYIPITSTDFLGFKNSRAAGDEWGIATGGEYGHNNTTPGGAFVERVIPIGFKATDCIVYGDSDGSGDNQFRPYEGAINANTFTSRGSSTTVGSNCDLSTDITGDGLKTCIVVLVVNEARDNFYGGKIILEKL